MNRETRTRVAQALRAAAHVLEGGMKGIADLVKQEGFILREDTHSGTRFAVYLRGLEVGEITIYYDSSCRAYVVGESQARRGWGPLLYDLAIEHSGDAGLMPDRGDVSQLADNVWWNYKHKRPDVEDHGDYGTYCRDHWGDAHLNRRYTKRGKPLTKELEARGLIGEKVVKTKDRRYRLSASSLREFERLAQESGSYAEFLEKTDGMDVLYRGHAGDRLEDNAFMSDWLGHAREYADNPEDVDALVVDLRREVMFFDNRKFDDMRMEFFRLEPQELKRMYRGNVHISPSRQELARVYEVLQGDQPYDEIEENFELNNLLVPLMQAYAKKKGKNIIGFLGGDFGGQNEFVVMDVSRYPSLREVWDRRG